MAEIDYNNLFINKLNKKYVSMKRLTYLLLCLFASIAFATAQTAKVTGMLVEAGVHYYNATGKTKLLEVATRCANLMAEYMGTFPKKNVVPAHSGPEEALVKLYTLYRDNPGR